MITTNLYNSISSLIESSRNSVRTAVNSTLVITYWNIGRLIVEDELQGEGRSAYGKATLKELSTRLSDEFGKGFDERNLRKFKQFYLLYPQRDAVSIELRWTHYRHLLKVENEQARLWYMNETVKENWSTRALERQINSHFYERLLPSEEELARELGKEIALIEGCSK